MVTTQQAFYGHVFSGTLFTRYPGSIHFSGLHQELLWASQLLGRDSMSHELSFWGRTCQHLTAAAPLQMKCWSVLISSSPCPFFSLHYKAVFFQNQNNWPCCSWELSFTLENVHVALLYISGRLEYICNTKGLCLKKWLMILAAQLWGTWKKHDKLLVIYVVFTVAVPCFP